MKAREVRELSDEELAQKIRETSREVASLRMRKLSGVPEAVARECLRIADTKLGIRTQLVSRAH